MEHIGCMDIKINRKKVFDHLRSTVFHGGYSQSQVHGIDRLLNVFEQHYVATWEQAHGLNMALQLAAYCLATCYWETGKRMMPVYETHARNSAQAIRRLEKWYRTKRPKRVTPYWREGWFGRGDVQLTHKYNYVKGTELLAEIGVSADLVANPELAIDPINSAHILFLGSYKGAFTGRRLADYIDADEVEEFGDYVHARAVINGRDKARTIARFAQDFEDALMVSIEIVPATKEPEIEPGVTNEPETTGTPLTESTTIIAAAGQAAVTITGVVSALGELNPWVSGVLIIVSAAALLWIVRERKYKSFLGV